MTKSKQLLELKGIDKRFPGVHALKSVNFELSRGECVALLGENGAGKSTLIKVMGEPIRQILVFYLLMALFKTGLNQQILWMQG